MKHDNSYITHHAIDRFAERILKQRDLVTNEDKRIEIANYILSLLEDSHPLHRKVKDGEFIFHEYNIGIVKTNYKVVTIQFVANNIDKDYHDRKTDQKRKRKLQQERKTFVRGKIVRRKKC